MTHSESAKVIQFYRNLREFTGGHLKHWHYFNHTYDCPTYLPYIYFGADTVWDSRNPWRYLQQRNPVTGQTSVPSAPLERPDALFVEGVSDWPVVQRTYSNLENIPTINLIQHVRHADKNNPRYEFLTQRAIRICVSQAVENALKETKRVNGPMVTIPCGMKITELPAPLEQKETDVCIAALKNPEMGRQLQKRIQEMGCEVVLLTKRMRRSHFLDSINQAKIILFLPWQTEGFYLPALEGMALNGLVICPDAVGNREFCRDGENCLNPAYEETKILAALKRALAFSDEARYKILQQGQRTAEHYSLRAERQAFLDVLENLQQLW